MASVGRSASRRRATSAAPLFFSNRPVTVSREPGVVWGPSRRARRVSAARPCLGHVYFLIGLKLTSVVAAPPAFTTSWRRAVWSP